jgi:hypothetical protein
LPSKNWKIKYTAGWVSTGDSDKLYMKEQLKKIKPLHHIYLFLLKKKRWLYNRFTIPDYEVKRNTIRALAIKFNCTRVFLETGTYMGDTVAFLKYDFEQLISIELSENLANRAIKRFANDSHIRIIQGDSTYQLSKILASVQSPVTFWLDGHYSSEFQEGFEYIITAKGSKYTPIMEELREIKNYRDFKHVILIDDARLFVGKDDYPTKDEVRKFVKNNLPGYSFSIKKDIIPILPIT